MSEPSASIGLPVPHFATQAVGMPMIPSCTVKPTFRSRPTMYFDDSVS